VPFPNRLSNTRSDLAVVFLVLLVTTGCTEEPPTVGRPRTDLYWERASQQLEPEMTVEEVALALARWVATHGTNDHRAKGADGLPFFGLCGLRSTVYENLAERAGLNVQRFAMDGFNDSGHTAVHVAWDGAWHYLDVTYAGYFRVDGRILSFDEIQEDPSSALEGMVVIEGTLDRWPDGRPVDNHDRMRLNYTYENILAAEVVLRPNDRGAS